MASSVDLSTLLNNLTAATTIMETFTKSMQAKDAQVDALLKVIQTKDTQIEALTKAVQAKENKADLGGMRDQILSNAFVLWPMIQTMDEDHDSDEFSPPDFRVIIGEIDGRFRAEVIYGNYEHPCKYPYIEGNEAKSAEEAMAALLEASMSLMGDFRHYVMSESPDEYRTTKGGHWYGPPI